MLPYDRFLSLVQNGLLVAFDLIVRDPEGRVLVGLRNNRPAQGYWFVPGGIIRKTENLPEAFQRVTREELGMPLELKRDAWFHGLYEHIYEDNFAGEPEIGTHYIVLAYEIRLAAVPDILPQEQHNEYRWLSPKELVTDPKVHQNTKNYFKDTGSAVEYARSMIPG